jgi:hypothetical protein
LIYRHFKKLKANQDIRDNINEWVEDTLFNVILRKQHDHSDKDKKLLYLYRLLAIKYRVVFPLKGESFKLDEDLRVVLETKICNAALKYFNDIPDGYKPTKTKNVVTAVRAATQMSAAARSKSATNSKGQAKGTATKAGRAPPAHHKYNAPTPSSYYAGGQQTKSPAMDTYTSTNMPTTSAARQPSSTDRHVRFADDQQPTTEREANVPQPMTTSGFTAGVI